MRLSDLIEGDIIVIDDGFTCAKAGEHRVYADDDGLFFYCREGKHYLDGQEDETGYLIGILDRL